MKRIFTILFAILLVQFARAQQDTTNIEQYCQIVAASKLFSRKVNVYIDFGQQLKFFSGKNTAILGDSERPKSFNSVVDAINFMGLKGWTIVNAYPITVGNQNVYHYLFKRKCTVDEVEKLKGELETLTGSTANSEDKKDKNFWE